MSWIEQHQPCPHCGSSDAASLSDTGWWKCFSCDRNWREDNEDRLKKEVRKMSDVVYRGDYLAIPQRGISEETAKVYKVKTDSYGNIYYPLYDKDGNLVATKVRVAGEKQFRITGDFSRATLFGQNIWGTGGKYITIVEGQDDAMAAYQMLGSKWPVVSVHSASSAVRDVLKSLDFLESYENVIVMFDSDEPGQEAARKVAEKLSPNKAKIVTLQRYKDANDYLKAGKVTEFVKEWWNQKTVTPAGVVEFSNAWEQFVKTTQAEIIPLPDSMFELSKMLKGGIAKGEITTIGALTSVGKTTFVNNLLHGFLSQTECKIGYCGLETTVGELVRAMLSLEAQRNLFHEESVDPESLYPVFERIPWKNRLEILDHQGSLDLDSLITRIRNMIVAFDLDVFILDPLQQALPTLDNDTVKEAMDKLLKLAKQTNVSFVIISHMRKPDTKNPHDVSEYDLLGSSAINQVSFNTILLSRDKMAEDELVKNSVKLRLVKCRRTGITGDAGWLVYNKETARLEGGEDPYVFSTEEF